MKSSQRMLMPKTPQNQLIYKEEEFELFLRTLEIGAQGHWVEIAKAVGVDRETIAKWRVHPKAIEVRKKAIVKTLQRMQEVGDRDWRMHEAKLKLLSVQAPEKIEFEGTLKTEQVHIYKPEKKAEGG